MKIKTSELTAALLDWYKHNGRNLPWRIKGGAHPDPYIILVSEFMLQQTTVKTVIPYFERFIKRFPTIQNLAAASLEEVYSLWQGLGYYSRARSLHETAKTIASNGFPKHKEEVIKLKGIGTYTAASFLTFAYNQPETVIDGNVIRVICRLYHLTDAPQNITSVIHQKAQELTDQHCPADYASAIMDLGALICTPKSPKCSICPWQKSCLSRNATDLENIPFKKKAEKKQMSGTVCIITNSKNEIFIRQHTEKGLLSGLYEFPWSFETTFLAHMPHTDTQQSVTHIFTHIKLVLSIRTIKSDTIPLDGIFIPFNKLENYALSTLMKKILQKINK